MIVYHGGVPGLNPGDVLYPHPPNVVDGCAICVARAAGEDWRDASGNVVDPATRERAVYVTSDRRYARFYASRYPYGDLYRVRVGDDVPASAEDHWPTWCAPEAVVVSVLDRRVRLTDQERRALVRRWVRLDRAAGMIELRPMPILGQAAGKRFG